MPKTNRTRVAVLGLLTTSCKTGYDMKQFIDQSLAYFWKISYGQIYPTLKQLVEDGAVRIKNENADKKEYEITSVGREELTNWLSELPDALPTQKNELLLKLFFSKNQEVEKSVALLRHQQELLEEKLAAYEAIEEMIRESDEESEDELYWMMTLDHGKRLARASYEWCEASIKTLRG
ncbi:PadR family transcriptional regulator [Paenalkalicoccus suaedae]|uniref:PadR family transcriptional regulator n=1 Tax=Paenalkalicoccus suaedae TaxID=2592382 RepID=A0A859F9X5_9BACI|nr:PadR family transcriptional regulator [Paenalkalicoccus suaedae]QKS70013.1 PadR family transcriptional regulator [Paenalkalicoccus suaedae]